MPNVGKISYAKVYMESLNLEHIEKFFQNIEAMLYSPLFSTIAKRWKY